MFTDNEKGLLVKRAGESGDSMKRAGHRASILFFAVVLPAALLVTPLWTSSASADPTSPSGGFSFTVSGGDLTITGCDPSCFSVAIVIPPSIGSDPVTSIAANAFANDFLTSVGIPSSVTLIGDDAFYDNDLTSVTIPDSVTSIGEGTFNTNQLTSVTIPDSVTSIGDDAFQSNLLTSVTIPASVTTIGNYAFSSDSLTSLNIPSSVTSIGADAFSGSSLTSLTIPSSVTSIGADAFFLNNLSTVTFLGSAPTFGADVFAQNPSTIGYYYQHAPGWSFVAPGSLGLANLIELVLTSPAGGFTFSISGSILAITGCDGDCPSSLAIPSSIGGDSVTSIQAEAFEGESPPTSPLLDFVTIPDSVTSIGNFAFADNLLSSVTIPSSVTDLGVAAFQQNLLTSVVIPSSITTINASAFDLNFSLTSVTFLGSVTSIGDDAFHDDPLGAVAIPTSVTSIGYYAFANSKLTTLTIPASVTSIDGNAFYGSMHLASVIFLGSAPVLGSNVFTFALPGDAYYYTDTTGWNVVTPPDVAPLTLTPIAPVSVSNITLAMSSGPNYDATGSTTSWSVTVPQDSATTIQSANYTLNAADVVATGLNTADSYPVTFVSGPGVSNGDPYGTLTYSGSGNEWTLTPGSTQSFETAGTWVLATTLSDLAGQTTTVQLTLIVNPRPSVTTSVATDVTTTTATLNATLTNLGTDTVTDLAFCYSSTPFTTGNCTGTIVTAVGSDPYSATVMLSPDTPYYVEFEGTDATLSTTLYGGVETFTTLAVPFSIPLPQAPLTLTSTNATLGTPLNLSASGGSGTGALSFQISMTGNAGCSLTGNVLNATSEGTCLITVTKAADALYAETTSQPTTVTVTATTPPISPNKPSPIQPHVQGVARDGRTVTLEIIGSGFAGRPTITSDEPGTVAVVLHDSGTVLVVRVSEPTGSAKGLHVFTIHLLDDQREVVNYRVE
jgi:hypothetical protein